MSTAVQLRRGTTAQHATFTGATGEVTVDTDKDTVVVHDGSTAGGFPLLGSAAIGVTVQGYDVDTAKLDTEQTWANVQRTNENIGTSLTLDLDAAYLDFNCTPAAGGALTFSNIPASPLVQKGSIVLINGSNYTITAGAGTKVTAALLATISATGTYLINYRTSNGVVYLTTAGAQA
jgi:hypothetical protein